MAWALRATRHLGAARRLAGGQVNQTACAGLSAASLPSRRWASSCCGPKGGNGHGHGHSRGFASGKDDKEEETFFPDSWVEPEALWDYAQAHPDVDGPEHVDDAFANDFGRRNTEWRKKMLAVDAEYFSGYLGKGQAPKYLWIGCCDSRVAAENLVGGQPGEIFVHRNIANQVISTDTNLRAVLHYAVDYLKVEHIIVCGHYDCGGVRAAASERDHASPLESWLTNIRDVYRLHQDELEAIINDDERHKRLVELNVIEQCLNLYKTGDVQRKRSKSAADGSPNAYPRVHGMVFDPADGILRRLHVDFKEYLRRYQKVYRMYDADGFATSYDTPR